MPKRQEEFLDLPFGKLKEIIERTLEALKPLGWEIKSDEQKENKVRWVVKVSSQLLPGELLTDLLFGVYHKVLVIEVYNNKILVECREKIPGYVIDWQGEKKQILDEFFLHLDSMLKSGTLCERKLKRRHGIATRLLIILSIIILVIVGLAIFIRL